MSRDFAALSLSAYFILFVAVEFLFSRARLGSRQRGNRGRLSMAFFFMGPFLGITLWMRGIRSGWAPQHPTWLLWGLGVAIGLLGFAIRIVGKRTLGRFFSVRVQLQEGHELVDQGIYSRIRHPLYLGFLLEWVAPPLLMGSPMGLLFTTLPILVGILYRIPREEALLVEGLGGAYRDYMGRTKRLIPGVW